MIRINSFFAFFAVISLCSLRFACTQRIDKTAYSITLTWKDMMFIVQVKDRRLTIQPSGLEIVNQEVSHEIDGIVSQVEIGDLNDEFAMVEDTFVQRFPIYNPEDSNAAPTGGTRQIQYQLVDGEASRRFEVDKVIEY